MKREKGKEKGEKGEGKGDKRAERGERRKEKGENANTISSVRHQKKWRRSIEFPYQLLRRLQTC